MSENISNTSFRNKAAYGKRIEFYLIGQMLKEGLDLYLPLVDDDAIDAVLKKPDGSFVELQIKARSKDVVFGDAAYFSGEKHEYRKNYWFIFYSERLDKMWVMSSKEFIKESGVNKGGKNIGVRKIKFNGMKTKEQIEFIYPKFEKYLAEDFSRLISENPDA